MPALVVTLIGLGTLAFGAVYPWGYLPLFAAAALIGFAGLWRDGVAVPMRLLAIALGVVWLTAAIQLLPLPIGIVEALNPRAIDLLSNYKVGFSTDATARLALSINPAATRIALAAIAALSLYLLGLPELLRGRHLRGVPAALATLAVPLALFAIYTREYNDGLLYGFWRPYEGGGKNQAGPFVNRNHFGGWMLMTGCVLVGSLIGQVERAFPRDGTRRQRAIAWLSSSEANRILLMAAAVLLGAVSLFWIMSRSAITGFAVGVTLFVWLARRRRELGATRRTVVLAIVVAAFLAGVTWRGPTRLVASFQDDASFLSRLDAWRDGWELVRNFPLVGTGLNTYPTAMLFYQRRNPGVYISEAHNDYLQLLAEGGLLVAVPAAFAIALLVRAVGRNLRAARDEARGYWIRAGAAVGMLAVGVQEIFEFSLQIPANALLFCTLAAMALTPVGTRAGSPAPRDTIAPVEGSAGGSLP